MIEYINECAGCAAELGCDGRACRYMNVPRFYCDGCGAEKEGRDRTKRQSADEVLYEYDGNELCIECLFNEFPRGEADEETECGGCGSGAYGSELAEVDDRRLCKQCLAKEFERVSV